MSRRFISPYNLGTSGINETYFVFKPDNISDIDIIHARMILDIYILAELHKEWALDPSAPSKDEFPTIVFEEFTPKKESLLKSIGSWLKQKLTLI